MEMQMNNKLGDRRSDPKTGASMVYVPSGKFMMGARVMLGNHVNGVESPVHEQVIEQGYWLDLTPVTNAAYAEFVADGGYRRRDLWTAAGWNWREKKDRSAPKNWLGFTAPDQPRVCISWYEAWAFAAWRGGRLPTEAEWEYAARSPESWVYPWGNDFDATKAVYRSTSGKRTAAVGSRPGGASWVGALDMIGNVSEWVSSRDAPYPYDAKDGRESVDQVMDRRVLRGGSWNDYDFMLRLSARVWNFAESWNYFNGFRVALDGWEERA